MILNFRSYGSGKPLVILHGLFGSSDNWQTFAKSIADHFQVFTLDIRNHGQSGHSPEFNYDLIARDIWETLESLQISTCNLLGHSMGGKAAAIFALKFPVRVEKLMVIDIAMRSYPPHHQVYFDALLAINLSSMHTRNEAEDSLKTHIEDQTIRQFLLKNLTRDDAGNFKWRFNLEALYQHYEEINIEVISSVPFTKPCLFVKGSLSNYIKESDEAKIKELFPESRIVTIEGAGHWVHADKPLELKEIFLEFMDNE